MNTREMTDSQMYGRDANSAAQLIAQRLEHLAVRIREIGSAFERSDGKAGRHAADLVSEFTNATGGVSAHLWNVIQTAADADRAHVKR